jgi:hypothetical protein
MLILHVDDDFDDREIFQELLQLIDPGIECVQKESGDEAIDYLGSGI